MASALSAVLIVVQAWDHEDRRAGIYRAAAESPADAAEMIATAFGKADAVCHPTGTRDDRENLISALFALERFGLSPLEAELERLAVSISSLIGLTPPDFSYGAGQIRLHRALALEREARRASGALALAAKLLDPCAARPIARRLITLSLGDKANADQLSRSQIAEAAAGYNAQASPDSARDALAHRLYNEIAYHLALHYRYASRRGHTAKVTRAFSAKVGSGFASENATNQRVRVHSVIRCSLNAL